MISEGSHRVLIVEDDFETRAALSDVLESDGYDVEGVCTAKEALEHDDLGQYTAIILDRRLPDGNADSLLPELRELAPNTSVIIATGHADLDSTIAALRGGAADYILKPINPDLLRASLNRLKQLREARHRAGQAERLAAIGKMVSVVAHESRNALQRILARTELMRLIAKDSPVLLENLGAIQDASWSLSSMLDELRDYSAPIVLCKDQVDLVTPIERAWESLQIRSTQRQATMRIESRSAFDLACCIDGMRIEQVFRNLFENALDSSVMPAEITVTLSAANLSGNGAIQVSIRDNGPGFTEEQRQNAFEPFFTTKNAGTGLGLAISKRIMDAHNGRIRISPATSAGGEVVLLLPASRALDRRHRDEVVSPMEQCQTA